MLFEMNLGLCLSSSIGMARLWVEVTIGNMLECDGLVSQVYRGAGKSMLGIGSQKTTKAVVLRMRAFNRCRLCTGFAG